MKAPSFDLLVVGAGPAGCAAALRGAALGLRVAIVERSRFPRDVPGESLHPDINELFDVLDVREDIAGAGFLMNPGWMLEQGDEQTFMPYAEPPSFRFGYQAWRADLDALLLAIAAGRGVEVYPETDAREVIMSSGRACGLLTSAGELSARHLVDATGPRRWLSRKLSITSQALSPRLVARYGYSSRDFGLRNIPRFREHANGWSWLAMVRSGTWQCVQLSLTPGKELPSLPEEFGFPTRLRGADVTWRLVRECAGPGWFLCGDAAMTLDPAASRGVARALQSGIRAAELAADVYAGELDDEEAASRYREWLTGDFLAEAAQLASRHSVLREAPRWATRFGEKHAVKALQ